jgi:hypothetical protein
MLSNHERRELARIEEGLAAEDRRLTQVLSAFRSGGHNRRRRWLARAVSGFGILVLVAGLVAGADAGLMLQGLLITAVGVTWSWLRGPVANHPPGMRHGRGPAR